MIRIPQVRVIDEEGTQLGVMPTPRALEMAQERGFDLVEVAPMAAPPVVRFRGRELTHPEIGRALLTRFTEQIKDHGVVERAPLLEGKQMHLTVASVHKPKVQEAPA